MINNPYLNAALAAAYIFVVVLGINTLGKYAGPGPDNPWLAPLTMLSLLVLSVAIMAFLFFFRPLVLLIDNKRQEALSFFMRTVATFAGVTVLVLSVAFVVFA